MAGTAAPLVVEGTREFLRRYAPFSGMDDAALNWLIARLKLAYFAKDAAILSPQSGPVRLLHIVYRGVVARRGDDPQAQAGPTLGPGEMFPLGSLSAGTASTNHYRAVQDCFCYLLGRDDWLALREQSPEFERYCTEAITEILRQSRMALQGQYSQRAAERETLTRPLAELVRRAPVSCAATAPLSEALAAMRNATARTIIVVDADGAPVGIFSLTDLLERVVLPERALSTPIREVMSAPAMTLPASASASEALQESVERNIRQIVVVENGALIGLVSERDLFALQRVSVRQVSQQLNAADDPESLKHAADDIRHLTHNLLAQGIGAEALARSIASLNDSLSRRAIELVLERHDLSDIDWCWLALGSEGRSEQTFATDQDNALVFEAENATEAQRLRPRLLAFAAEVNSLLDTIGFPLCVGNVMASNPELCLSVDEWKLRFLRWIREPTPQALLNANIVFDFRPLAGDARLANALIKLLHGYSQEAGLFLRLMAQNALQADPPLGIIRAFATDDDSSRKGTVDLKTRGTRLFVDAARVYALAFGITDTGTAGRLRSSGKRLNIEERHVDAAIVGFQFLQMLRLRVQDSADVRSDPNRIDPYLLNEVDQRMLKEAFRQARLLQHRLKESYRL